jgi:hypothetical protein
MKYFLTFMSFVLVGALVGPLAGCAMSGATFGSVSTTGTATTGNGVVQLNWTASSGSPIGYYVEQSSNGGATFTQVQTVTTPTARVTGLVQGTTYQFRIRAYNQGGDSTYTSVISVSIPAS